MSAPSFVRFALIALAVLAEPSRAQTYTVQSVTAPSFGTVAAAAGGSTVFALDAATGAVVVASGSGGKVSGTTARATVTINCANGPPNGASGRCNQAANKARIKIGKTGSPTGRAGAVQAFEVAGGTATAGTVTTAGDGSISFDLSGWTGTGTRTFYVGMELPVAADSGGASGAAQSGFYVYAAKSPSTPATGRTANASITTRRSLEMTKTADLSFGTIVRPASGSGTVAIDAATGARTAGGSAVPALVAGPASGRAEFDIEGEPGTTVSIAIPASFAMTNGGDSLTVTRTATATGTQTLTGGLLTLGIGGSIPVSATTPTGAYSGTLSVTVAYN